MTSFEEALAQIKSSVREKKKKIAEQITTVKSDCLFVSVEFLREEVVVLLAAQFITLFNQTALEVQ